MNLEQSTTLYPFMQKLILLAHIALRTGYRQIIWRIRTATRQGYHMVNVVSILTFTQFLTTIVTLALLPLVLSLNIFNGMASWGFLFQSYSISRIRAYQFPISVGIFSTLCLAFLFVDLRILFVLFSTASFASSTQARAFTWEVFSRSGQRPTTWAGTGTHWLLRLCRSLFCKPCRVTFVAVLANMIKTVFIVTIQREIINRCQFFFLHSGQNLYVVGVGSGR